MRRAKLLGLALIAIVAFGVVIAATASAEEKEPAGLLYLPKEEGPVLIKGEGKEAFVLSDGLLKVLLKCAAMKFEAEVGKGEGAHSALGTLTIEFKGCALVIGEKKLACTSENQLGEKDAKETVLLVKE